jgi:hypothetical protein
MNHLQLGAVVNTCIVNRDDDAFMPMMYRAGTLSVDEGGCGRDDMAWFAKSREPEREALLDCSELLQPQQLARRANGGLTTLASLADTLSSSSSSPMSELSTCPTWDCGDSPMTCEWMQRFVSPADGAGAETAGGSGNSDGRAGVRRRLFPVGEQGSLEAAAGSVKMCACKRTRCMKLYCDCVAAGVECGSRCKCLECQNVSLVCHERLDPAPENSG